MVNKNLFLFLCIIIAVLTLVSCNNSTPADTVSTDTEIIDTLPDKTDTDTDTDTDTEIVQGYFVATISKSEYFTATPFTDGNTVSKELDGIFYSADAPGGKPRDDGSGKIYLTVKPLKTYNVTKLVVSGEYSSVEKIGMDLYCIHGVKSDLTVNASTITMPSANKEYFKDYGYGITDDGRLNVSWIENENEPLRYVELTYTDKYGTYTSYVDAKESKKELLRMNENEIYNVSIRAVGETRLGKKIDFTCCYMEAPKNVSFPRIEITTENYVWPSCDFVSSPDDCWGAGITNALYQQCVAVIYNENNEIVYSSASTQCDKYQGAKLKIRGNTSARYASNGRFPYKLKLDAKSDLLAPLIGRSDDSDIYADKDWILLNYGNDGYRICGDAIADGVGTEWSPDYCYVTLYLNGEYRGLYVLSEAVEEGSGDEAEKYRVNVDSDGYVFECDAYWWNEDYYFSTPLTEDTPMYFTFKYPDPDLTPDYTYLREYLIKFEEALMRDDESYLEYIDLDSFVKWLLVSDLLCIEDGGGCNIFLYKKNSSDETKLCMGPNWDFDSYMGSVDGLSTIRMKWDGAPFYYQYLVEKESFVKRYTELFYQVKDNLASYVNNAFDSIDIEAHSLILNYDNMRFGTSKTTLATRKGRFLTWLAEHIDWMETQFRK